MSKTLDITFLPYDFNVELYLACNKDLLKKNIKSKKKGILHYLTYGCKENRVYSVKTYYQRYRIQDALVSISEKPYSTRILRKCTIYGERCSGTTFLKELLTENFNVEMTWEYGWKHFFGFASNLETSDDTLFVCIVRNLFDWINSFYVHKHHWYGQVQDLGNISEKNVKDLFINHTFYSLLDDGTEIMMDRHIYTGERYKNIFELRATKLKFLIEDLPHKIGNYILIRYEDLLYNFEDTMKKIESKGLERKHPNFINSDRFGDSSYSYQKMKRTENLFSQEEILNSPFYEKQYEILLKYPQLYE